MNDKEKKTEKYFLRIMNIIIVVIILMILLFIWQIIGMFDDHQCWIDGYQSEHCQKYIRRND